MEGIFLLFKISFHGWKSILKRLLGFVRQLKFQCLLYRYYSDIYSVYIEILYGFHTRFFFSGTLAAVIFQMDFEKKIMLIYIFNYYQTLINVIDLIFLILLYLWHNDIIYKSTHSSLEYILASCGNCLSDL